MNTYAKKKNEPVFLVHRVTDSGNELYHYGVKGMKWGVRRYRNEDGSYTDAGKKRNFKKIEKAYRKDVKTHYKNYNAGVTYRKLARKNPDLAKALEPAIKAKQKFERAADEDSKLLRKETDAMVKEYVKKHGKSPDYETTRILRSKAYDKVGTPNLDAQEESYINTRRDVVNNVLGKYADKELRTFNLETGKEVLLGYLDKEAVILNEEDKRNGN